MAYKTNRFTCCIGVGAIGTACRTCILKLLTDEIVAIAMGYTVPLYHTNHYERK